VVRTFPAPWRFIETENGYCILDATGQALAYVFADEPNDQGEVVGLTWDDAWRVARVISTVPEVLKLSGHQARQLVDEESERK